MDPLGSGASTRPATSRPASPRSSPPRATRPSSWASVSGPSGKAVARASVDSHVSEHPAVVLLHGQPGSGLHWRRVIDRLPEDLRVVAEDRPGYGANANPPTGFFGHADAVIARLDELELERAVV